MALSKTLVVDLLHFFNVFRQLSVICSGNILRIFFYPPRCLIQKSISGVIAQRGKSAECFDMLRACRISLTHIRTYSDCVTKFWSPSHLRTYRSFITSDIVWKSLKLQGSRVVFMVKPQRVLAGLFALEAGTPIVETRSRYRAHFTRHTNNFHRVGLWWVTAEVTLSSPLLQFFFYRHEKKPHRFKHRP